MSTEPEKQKRANKWKGTAYAGLCGASVFAAFSRTSADSQKFAEENAFFKKAVSSVNYSMNLPRVNKDSLREVQKDLGYLAGHLDEKGAESVFLDQARITDLLALYRKDDEVYQDVANTVLIETNNRLNSLYKETRENHLESAILPSSLLAFCALACAGMALKKFYRAVRPRKRENTLPAYL